MTRFEKIKAEFTAMTVEQAVEENNRLGNYLCEAVIPDDHCFQYESCRECKKAWLEQEADDGE